MFYSVTGAKNFSNKIATRSELRLYKMNWQKTRCVAPYDGVHASGHAHWSTPGAANLLYRMTPGLVDAKRSSSLVKRNKPARFSHHRALSQSNLPHRYRSHIIDSIHIERAREEKQTYKRAFKYEPSSDANAKVVSLRGDIKRSLQ